MKTYKLENGDFVLSISTAQGKTIQLQLSPSGECSKSIYPDSILAELEEVPVESELYGAIENAVALQTNRPSFEMLQMVYSLIESKL
jgi:hypothetical protein